MLSFFTISKTFVSYVAFLCFAFIASPFGSSDTDLEDLDNLDSPSLKLPNTVHSEIAEYARNESEILLRDVVPSAILDERLSARNHEIINLPVPLLSAPSDLPPWRRKDKISSQSRYVHDLRYIFHCLSCLVCFSCRKLLHGIESALQINNCSGRILIPYHYLIFTVLTIL